MVRISSIIAISAACILAVSARPAKHSPKPFSLPVRKHSHGTFKQTVIGDHKRLSMLSSKVAKGPVIIATNDYTYYTFPVSFGTPARTIEMALDTSTPFTMIPNFDVSSSSTCLNASETGIFNSDIDPVRGDVFIDQISIGPHNFQQGFGIGRSLNGVNVMGFGLTFQDGKSISTGTHIPSIMDNLAALKMVPSNVVGLHFKPVWNTSVSAVNGEIDIGWINPAKYTGNIAYSSLVTDTTNPGNWMFNIPSIQFGGNTVITGVTAILDAGVALIYVNQQVLKSLFGTIHGGRIDTATGLFTIPNGKTKLLQPITFTIGGSTITWSPSQYLINANHAASRGLTGDVHYLNIGQLGLESYDIALGLSFIESFYTILDTTHEQIGFATRV